MNRDRIAVREPMTELSIARYKDKALYTYLDMTSLEQYYNDDRDDDNLRNNNSSVCQ